MKYGVIAVGYNRPSSLRRLVCSLLKAEYYNEIVDLIISIDKIPTAIIDSSIDILNIILYVTIFKIKSNSTDITL